MTANSLAHCVTRCGYCRHAPRLQVGQARAARARQRQAVEGARFSHGPLPPSLSLPFGALPRSAALLAPEAPPPATYACLRRSSPPVPNSISGLNLTRTITSLLSTDYSCPPPPSPPPGQRTYLDADGEEWEATRRQHQDLDLDLAPAPKPKPGGSGAAGPTGGGGSSRAAGRCRGSGGAAAAAAAAATTGSAAGGTPAATPSRGAAASAASGAACGAAGASGSVAPGAVSCVGLGAMFLDMLRAKRDTAPDRRQLDDRMMGADPGDIAAKVRAGFLRACLIVRVRACVRACGVACVFELCFVYVLRGKSAYTCMRPVALQINNTYACMYPGGSVATSTWLRGPRRGGPQRQRRQWQRRQRLGTAGAAAPRPQPPRPRRAHLHAGEPRRGAARVRVRANRCVSDVWAARRGVGAREQRD